MTYMTQKRALITGCTGQDGSYLCELLLAKGYQVFGLQRRASTFNTLRIDHIFDKITMVMGDLTDSASLSRAVDISQPDEVYNLAAQSHVRVSFDTPVYTGDTDALGYARLLDILKERSRHTKIYQAGSSEMFGKVQEIPQTELTPFYPRSPYGVAKQYAHWLGINYRESYNMFICNGILFNHESPRRGETFVTRKIARAVARISRGKQSELVLGNLDAKRDWGYAKDYVEAMWMMLQQTVPDDYVIATGETHSVREFLEECFHYVGITSWQPYVKVHSRYFRPAEVELLLGDSAKARMLLGWKPTVTFKGLVALMMEAELEAI
jgi:GDPmannose 4,6-dehydratase